MNKLLVTSLLLGSQLAVAQSTLKPLISVRANEIESKVVSWRRDLHQHPELGNQEFRTAKIVADHLKSLGLEVQEGEEVAKNR